MLTALVFAVTATSPCYGAPARRAAVEAVGRDLFFAPQLSADGSVSCASCHHPEDAYAERRPTSRGIGGRIGERNAPTVVDALQVGSLFWDGRAPTLQAQAGMPLLDPREMGQPSEAAVEASLTAAPALHAATQEAFGRAPDFAAITCALATFEQTLHGTDSPFERYMRGDDEAMSAEAKRGWALFVGQGRCVRCHTYSETPRLLADGQYHNLGIGSAGEGFQPLTRRLSELGRFALTDDAADLGAFRTSPLRNVGVTSPYMHDGSLATLWDVMDHYNRGGDRNRRLDPEMQPLGLSEADIDDLVELMFALTDDQYAAAGAASHARQVARRDIRPERDGPSAPPGARP